MTTIQSLTAHLLLGAILLSSISLAEAVPNKPAPDFRAKDALGKAVKLADFKGQWIVLEWFNKDCPFVKKHYGSNNMQDLQKKYTQKGVKWIQVISSAPGKQGHMDGKSMVDLGKAQGHAATTTLLDEDGSVGKSYGAKTTPHMFIINPDGIVVYAGAIDDNDSSNPSVIPTSKNYVAAALDAGLLGKDIAVSASKAYGCSVKY